jgi:gliding motility-associated-like protein
MRRADTIFRGQQVQLFSNGNAEVRWHADATLSCADCPNPIASPVTTTTYTATNFLANGCEVSDRFTVVVLNDAMVMTPSAFTPNGDGLNDYFGPIGKVPENYRLQVFNRNGETVFRSSAMNQKWDGSFRGVPQPTSVFIYLIEYRDIQNILHQQKGTFTLIR